MRTAEALGYAHLVPPDHVLGVNPSADHSGRRVGTTANACHDPFVLFGFLSGCTQQIGFAVGVLILAQRRTILVAKQAASLEQLSGGRFQLRIGVGWNEVEFVGLNENLRNRGKRSAAQVKVMQALWAGPHVRFAGEFHRIDNAGINRRPASGACRSGMAGTPKRPSSAAQNMATATCRSSIPRVRPPSRRLPNYGH